jgi:hypothetical protein
MNSGAGLNAAIFFKPPGRCTDNKLMARRFTGWWVGILVLAVLGWHRAFPAACFAADPLPAEVEEDLPDMNFIKAQAEAGRAKYQTQLADFSMAAADFTNAVFWYRKAADQGYAPAQLSLAGCLMAGRGVPKNSAEAARLLRRAADGIEASSTNDRSARVESTVVSPSSGNADRGSPGVSALPLVASTNINPSLKPVAPSPALPVATPTNVTRVERAATLLATEPAFQSAPPVLRPPSYPR